MRRLPNVIANTTCACQACANVGMLDLKIMAHHGSFDEMKVGPVSDISGADVILVHRMAKSDVKEATGIGSYALFSDAAVKAMDITEALVPFSQAFEHFGDTVQNLATQIGAGFRPAGLRTSRRDHRIAKILAAAATDVGNDIAFLILERVVAR